MSALGLLGGLAVITAAGIWALAAEIRQGQERWNRQHPGTGDALDAHLATAPTEPPAPEASRAPERPAPAPGPRIVYTVRAWDNGAVRVWDGDHRLIFDERPPAADLDEELRNLIDGQH